MSDRASLIRPRRMSRPCSICDSIIRRGFWQLLGTVNAALIVWSSLQPSRPLLQKSSPSHNHLAQLALDTLDCITVQTRWLYHTKGTFDRYAHPVSKLTQPVSSSPNLRFLIGKDNAEFFLHPALASHHSIPLEAMMHGSMKEAKEGSATIGDVDEDTFSRFCEYAYTGDYTAAEHSALLHSIGAEQQGTMVAIEEEKVEEQQTIDVQMAVTNDYSSYTGKKKGKKRTNEQAGYYQEVARYYDTFEAPKQVVAARQIPDPFKAFSDRSWPRDSTRLSSSCRPNEGPCEDYSDVLLSHAKIYVFADKYDIPALRSLALHNLHETLVTFTLYTESVPDIAILFRYVCENTPERDDCIDQLRALVIEYVACYVEKMTSNEVFEEVLRSDSSASIELTKMMLKRLR